MAYTPLQGQWYDMRGVTELPSGTADTTQGYWGLNPNVDYGQAPVPGASQVFDENGNMTGWTTQNGERGTFQDWVIDPATGQLSAPTQGSQTVGDTTSRGRLGRYGAGLFGGAILGAGAASLAGAGALGGTGAATAPSGASWGLTGGAFGTGGAATAADVAAALGTGGAAAGGLGGAGSAVGGAGGAVPAATSATGGGMFSLPTTAGGWGSAISNWLPIAGAIGGALQGGQDQTSTTQTQLPPWLQALGPQLTNASINAANQPFQPYGGTAVQPFNPNQQSAFNMIQNRATQGSAVERAGQDAVTRGATGNANPMFGLDNPYLNTQIDNAVGDINRNFNKTIVPQLDAMNTRANTGFGTSSAMDEMRGEAYRNLNETTAKTANDMRYKDYYNQTQLGEGMAGRQLTAAGLAPNMGALDYRNAEALLGIGNQQQQLGQQQQDFNYSEFMRQLQYPDQQLQRLGYPFGFNQGQTTSTTTPGAGAWAGGISGLLGGIGMSNMMGSGNAASRPATMTPPPNTGQRLDQYNPYTNPYTGMPWGSA